MKKEKLEELKNKKLLSYLSSSAKGMHVIVDCRNVKKDICKDDKRMLEVLVESAKEAGSTVINSCRYHFGHNSPPGFACMVMLDESHCTAHCYEDEQLIAFDFFTCGKHSNPIKVWEGVCKRLELDKNSKISKFKILLRFD